MSWFVKRVAIFLLILDQLSRTFQKSAIKPRTLSSSRLKRLADSTDYDEFRTFLSPILRSRVPGSNGHHSVKRHIIKFFKDLHWQVDVDEFDKDTVIGRKRFTNIIATANPNAEKFVLLTAHYDSKIMMSESNQNQEFLAASDSAVPCAMIMSIANSLHLNELMKNKNHSLQVVFFDGEEAFLNWNDNDSIYGSTHLAKLWSEPDGNGNTHLSSIEFLMLLDLLGEPNPRFYSGFPETHVYFERLCSIETRLRRENKLKSGQKEYFVKGVLPQSLGVEDDHIPFLRKGVPILHIIPIPFPKCWHKMCDDGKNIDETTVHDLLKIFQAFFREILRV